MSFCLLAFALYAALALSTSAFALLTAASASALALVPSDIDASILSFLSAYLAFTVSISYCLEQ